MRNGSVHYAWIEQRIRALGEEIFERAAQARPRFPMRTWWMEQATRFVDRDPRLKAAVFQFVDCLPVLTDDVQVARHLYEYLVSAGAPVAEQGLWCIRRAARGGVWSRLVGACARVGARAMAGRFIAGHDAESVRATLERLRRAHMTFTLDVLGESTTSDARADAYVGVFHDALERLCPVAQTWTPSPLLDLTEFGPQPRVNVSIKLTGMDPHFDPLAPGVSIESVARRLRPLLKKARELGAFVNIDIESTKHRALTFELFESVMMEPAFRDFADVGIVVQAYLADGERDLERMLAFARRRGTRFAVRLVKGAYWDSETAAAIRQHAMPPVWTRKWESDACYERMARTMLRERALIRPCFASHNVRTIAAVMAWAEHLGVPINGYECQMLYGMGDPLKSAVVETGRCVRVYAPYGDMLPGMAYLIRRLLENTSNDSFLKQGFADRERFAARLADPAMQRPPSAALPRLRYTHPRYGPERTMSTFRQTVRTSFASEGSRERMRQALATVRARISHPPTVAHDALAPGGCVVVNPSHPEEVVAHVATGDAVQADLAVARLARGGTVWGRERVEERCERLMRWADCVEAARWDYAATLVLHLGLLWREADAEVAQAVDFLRFHASCMAALSEDPRRRGVPGEDNEVRYSPRGPTVVFCDAASGLASAAAGLSASLAAGNPAMVVCDPEQAAVLTMLVEEAARAEIPADAVLTLVPAGDAVREHIARHAEVRLVAVFASAALCNTLRAACHGDGGAASERRVCLAESRGANPVIVDEDADVDAALAGVLASGLAFCGQKRDAATQLLMVGGLCDPFSERLAEALSSLRVGSADDPATHVGPLVNRAAARAARQRVETARAAGRLRYEASHAAGLAETFVMPAIVEGHDRDGRSSDWVPGPVFTVCRCADFTEAIRRVNAAGGARVGGVYSRSPANIEMAKDVLNVGGLFINRPTVGGEVDRHPIGGPTMSGAGTRVGDASLVEAMLVARTISENTLRHGFSPEQTPRVGGASFDRLQPV